MPTHVSLPPRPAPFLEAAPLSQQNLRRGEIPRQFSFVLFGEAYICEKDGRGGSGGGWPMPTPPPPVEPEAGRFSVLCDGEHKLIVRGEGVTLSTGSFAFASACAVSAKQFKAQAGCFCDAEHAIVCLDRGPTLTKVGSAFSFPSACEKALVGMDRGVEVRFRAPGR